jgi:hypothetical protein
MNDANLTNPDSSCLAPIVHQRILSISLVLSFSFNLQNVGLRPESLDDYGLDVLLSLIVNISLGYSTSWSLCAHVLVHAYRSEICAERRRQSYHHSSKCLALAHTSRRNWLVLESRK